jgi:hypothetical protein
LVTVSLLGAPSLYSSVPMLDSTLSGVVIDCSVSSETWAPVGGARSANSAGPSVARRIRLIMVLSSGLPASSFRGQEARL